MGKDHQDLGLSLSLSFPPNLTPSLVPSSASDPNPEYLRSESTRSFLRGIDVNRPPSTADCEEEAGVSSPNSTISSSVSGKRSERDGNNGDELELERASSHGISDEEDGDASRKKLRLSKDQSAILEECFKEHNTLNPVSKFDCRENYCLVAEKNSDKECLLQKQKLALAKQLGLRPRQVEVWFQNRRARTKLKQTEVDCEFLKRCCENLTEENRRLQKEVQELRALKLSPQLYMQMNPPTTLTMCPSCERVGVPPNASTTVDPRSHHHSHRHHVPINPWAPSRPFDALHPRS